MAILLLVTFLTLGVVATTAHAEPPRHTSALLVDISGTGISGDGELTSSAASASYRVHASGLPAGAVVTVWAVRGDLRQHAALDDRQHRRAGTQHLRQHRLRGVRAVTSRLTADHQHPATAGRKATTMATTAGDLVAEAKQHIRNLSVDEVATALDTETVTLVDIRERDEVEREGRIPGAVLAPRGMLEFWADPTSPYHREEFDPDAPTILYCASSGRSALAVRTLQTLGYGDVSHLEGGLNAWKDHGRPVTHTP